MGVGLFLQLGFDDFIDGFTIGMFDNKCSGSIFLFLLLGNGQRTLEQWFQLFQSVMTKYLKKVKKQQKSKIKNHRD